jgi:hypothetical protein
MLVRSIVIPPKLRQWVTYALILLAPGSFIILPAWWLVRRVVVAARTQSDGREARAALTTRRPVAGGVQASVLRRLWLRALAEMGATFRGLASGPCASAPRRSP